MSGWAPYIWTISRSGGFDTPVKELIGVNARQITAWNGSFSVLKDDLDALSDRGNRTCVIFAGTRKAADALRGDLIDDGYSALYMDELPGELAPGTLTVVPPAVSRRALNIRLQK